MLGNLRATRNILTGASAVNNSYTNSEDQGHYEQQATGKHWVVDVVGHWE